MTNPRSARRPTNTTWPHDASRGGTHVAAGLETFVRSDTDATAQKLDRVDATLARAATDQRDRDVAALRVHTAIQLVRDLVRQHPDTFGETE